MPSTLPAGFETLEPFVERFAVSGTAKRAARRSEASEGERKAFFEAAKDLIAPALDFLDKKPVDQLDEHEQRLMNMALTFAHISLAVDVQGADEARHAELRQHMRITRSPADTQN